MAYIEGQYNPDDEDKPQGQGQDATQQPLQLSQAAPGAATGSAPAATATPAPAGAGVAPPASQDAGRAPGRYVNFQQYFNANQDAATATGDKLASGIQSQGDAVQKGLAQSQGAFQSAVDQGTGAKHVVGGASPSMRTGANPLAGASWAQPATQAAAPSLSLPAPAKAGGALSTSQNFPGKTATSLSSPPANVAGASTNGTLQGYFSGAQAAPLQAPSPNFTATPKYAPVLPPQPQYSGPGSLSEAPGWADLVAKAGAASSAANQTATTSGLQSLLQQQNSGAGAAYTPGESRFDAGLTGAASGDKFANLRAAFGGLPQKLTDADTAAQAQAAAARTSTNAVADAQNAAAHASAQQALNPGQAAAPDVNAAHDAAVKGAIANSNWAHYQRGDWAQLDLANGASDARKYQIALNNAGVTWPESEQKTIYQSMTPDEYAEMELILNGQHPDSPAVEYQGGTDFLSRTKNQGAIDASAKKNQEDINAQFRAFMVKLHDKYVKG